MKPRIVIIVGAAGRDFHNFNTYFRNNPYYKVACFTATQIPGIERRRYPARLAGKQYKKGIPIYPEEALEKLIKKFHADDVVFSYSDVSHEQVMHLASRTLASGANFRLLGPQATMIKSKKKVIAVCAVRTGAGKSQTTRKIAEILQRHGKRVALIRHPMPYGNLEEQEVERFSKLEDLITYKTTIEEREEYEEPIRQGILVYAGVDYEKILRQAEKESNVILWDGGNNDYPFYQPDLLFVVADPLRAGHELLYHPGETNFRMADVIIINKENSATLQEIKTVEENAKKLNPRALLVHADSMLSLKPVRDLRGKKVLVVEDGPTVTHGGMGFGAGYKLALQEGAHIVNPKTHAVGSIKETFEKYPHLEHVLPAMGYSKQQIRELEQTINATPCDYVVTGTPIDLNFVLKTNKPVLHVQYELKEKGKETLEKILREKKFI
ncbi:MAG: GTPase [Candidatus Diapherotrites archaeon]|nr:GTPase [Candidatus Diapherotrites archaeon]